jgi:hypothetical protein
MRSSSILALATLLAASAPALAEQVIYDFRGMTYVGGVLRTFTGELEYNDAAASSTTYTPGTGNSTIQGFRSTYSGAVTRLSIQLSNGESVSSLGGDIAVSNLIQAEASAPLPEGLSMQAWTNSTAGSINGLQIRYMYLAFLPVTPNFTWDGLDQLIGNNSETLLDANPALLPSNVDTNLTGTPLVADLNPMFPNGLFLGTVHDLTTTVNTIDYFERRIPTPASATLLTLAAATTLRRRRR